MRTSASVKWHDLGLELLEQEDEEKLDEIENNNSDTKKCCTKMFQLWLSKYEDEATWNNLIKALREVDLRSLATRIEKMLTPLKDTVCASTGMFNMLMVPYRGVAAAGKFPLKIPWMSG